MRVAIDGRALLKETTGIGTYTRGIASALAVRPGTEVGLFSPRPLCSANWAGGWSVHADNHPVGLVWVQMALDKRAARWGADVLLAALTIGPVRGSVPLVSVVHDLTPWTHPQWHAARTLVGFAPLWEMTADRASRLICVSKATAREVLRLYPETASRVRVVANGVDPEFSPAADPSLFEETRRRYSGGRPFILYLGTLEPRKNVGALVAACEILWAASPSSPDLVLAGGSGWKSAPLSDAIARSPFRDKIHLSGYARREAAVALYRAAEVFVYPSLLEGFGLPVLEALACGTPVVASTAEALVEVAGDAALYAEARDRAGLARQIERVLDDRETRERLRAAGPAAARFSWGRGRRATERVLEEARKEGPREEGLRAAAA